jgi:predicted nucleic-acid-binding Zn-ribbon protein
MHGLNFTCVKCGCSTYEISEFRATGGFFTKVFNVQTKKFTTVSCSQCKYTEIYQTDSSMLGNVFDFFMD